jgi:hypothetical protein
VAHRFHLAIAFGLRAQPVRGGSRLLFGPAPGECSNVLIALIGRKAVQLGSGAFRGLLSPASHGLRHGRLTFMSFESADPFDRVLGRLSCPIFRDAA